MTGPQRVGRVAPRVAPKMRVPKPPAISERDFQRQVTDAAEILGWSWCHFRPAQTSKGWRTPVSGSLGAGWVDLILVRHRDRRLMFVELKADGAKTTAEQDRVLEVLRRLEITSHPIVNGEFGGRVGDFPDPSVAVRVWWPSDWPEIEAMLRGDW